MSDDTLSFLDAGFLDVEEADPHASLTIGALAIVQGPVPSQSEFRDAVAERLMALPHARDRLRTMPLDLGVPSWVEDQAFDLDRHLRRVAVPEPGEEDALFGFVARIIGHRLDRDHPLWECWVVEGLRGGRWAILAILHHCLADGIAGTHLFEAFCDEDVTPGESTDREPRPEDAPAHHPPAHAPVVPTVPLGLLATAVRVPLRIMTRSIGAARGLGQLIAEMMAPAAGTSLIGPIGSQRRYCGARTRMSDIREICEVFGVTVNDVALAAITGGLRTVLLSRGERPRAHSVRTLVPVSVRAVTEGGAMHNEISLMLPFLPVDVDDHVEQLTAVHERLTAHKCGGETQGGKAFTTWVQYAPFLPLSWTIRLAARVPQHSVVAVATNVPGPRRTRHVLGRRIDDIFACVPIALRLRVGIAVLSYGEALTFGITGDYDTNPDLPELASAIEHGVTSLVTAARLAAARSDRQSADLRPHTDPADPSQ